MRNSVKQILTVFVGLMIWALLVYSNAEEKDAAMKINVKANNKTTVFELNNSLVARDLYSQLPLSIKIEDYSDNEKIFYPPKKLNIADTLDGERKGRKHSLLCAMGRCCHVLQRFRFRFRIV